MKLFKWRKLSDAEIIERTRKNLKKGKLWGWISMVFSAAFICFFIWLLEFSMDWFASFSRSSNPDSASAQSFEMYRTGLKTGAFFGCIATILLAKAAFYLYESLALMFGNRRDKLLVAFYDQLHPWDAKAPAPLNTSGI